MKRTALIAIPIIVLCVGAFYAQSEPKRGPFPLVDVSGFVEAGPGFEIIDAYEIPSQYDVGFGTTYSLSNLEYANEQTYALSPTRFLHSDSIDQPDANHSGVFLVDLEFGIRLVLKRTDDNWGMSIIGKHDDVLLVYLRYVERGENYNITYRDYIVRVTGDWDGGTSIGEWGKM